MRIQHLKQWALSPKNNKIELFASADVSLSKACSPVLLIGGVHGDEPEGVELAQKTLGWLQNETMAAELRAYKLQQSGASSASKHWSNDIKDQPFSSGDKDLPIKVPWIVIPCINVDGYKAATRVNGNGVDLNRNYPSKSWSPKYEKERYYPGPHAASEPEIRALIELIEVTKPRVVIHCHSWNPSIVLSGPPALRDAEYLSECSGYEIQDDIGYPTPGSLSQWGWADRRIPIICIEEQEHIDLSLVWPHFEVGMKKIFGDSSLRR